MAPAGTKFTTYITLVFSTVPSALHHSNPRQPRSLRLRVDLLPCLLAGDDPRVQEALPNVPPSTPHRGAVPPSIFLHNREVSSLGFLSPSA